MPQVSNGKGQVARNGQMNKADMKKATPKSKPRDDLRTAYAGDENRGPAKDQKLAMGQQDKARRLERHSSKTPVR